MGLLRDRSIEEVVRHLDLVLPGVASPARPTVTGGAIVQARDRLGDQPLATLFTTTAATWASASAAELILPPRRSERRYPRAVKIKMSNYPLKRSRRGRRRVK